MKRAMRPASWPAQASFVAHSSGVVIVRTPASAPGAGAAAGRPAASGCAAGE